MQVLGELVRLPENASLPIPWWHRAPLGLQSGTWCYVALVDSNRRPVPDLIISVLDPSNWSSLRRVRCLHPDEPGVISKAVAAVRGFNIALAESATLQSGELHEVTLFCEPPRGHTKPPSDSTVKKRLRESGFHSISIDTFDDLPVIWQQLGEVNAGWIGDVAWRQEMKEHGNRWDAKTIDLKRAVVSADTTNRFARFVFPLKNARTVLIEHLDEPGVLQQLTRVLFDNQLNLLSKLLRRGGAKPRNAVLVAVCEPLSDTDARETLDNVRNELKQLPPKLMIKMRSHAGMKAENTITSREPNTVVARVPAGLVEKVRQVRSLVPASTKAVFFSHRFVNHDRATTLSDHVRKAVASNNCHLLEASPDDDIRGPNLIYDDVSSKMWAADAGIVLVADIGDDDPMGKNLPHEVGFMLGQGKPLLLLLDGKLDGTQPLGSNLDGVFAPRFPADEIAFATDDPNSIAGIIGKWVRQIGPGN